jgi:hypothetical protein
MAKNKIYYHVGSGGKVQQIIKNGVMEGQHYHTDVDLIDSNIQDFTRLRQQAIDATHISLKGKDNDILKEGIEYLVRLYTNSLKINLINQINLSFSEN